MIDFLDGETDKRDLTPRTTPFPDLAKGKHVGDVNTNNLQVMRLGSINENAMEDEDDAHLGEASKDRIDAPIQVKMGEPVVPQLNLAELKVGGDNNIESGT